MAQQIINYGAYADSNNADSIRLAFMKTDDNFYELFGNLANIAGNVSQIIAGDGITASNPTGAVTLAAQFAALTVHSNTLTVTGIGGFVPPGGNTGSDYTVDTTTNTLIVELDANISPQFVDVAVTGNLEVDGNATLTAGNLTLTAGNLTLGSGTLTGNIQIANANTLLFSNSTGVVTSDTNLTYVPGNLTLNLGNIAAQSFNAGFSVNTVNLATTNATVYGPLAVGSNVNITGDITSVENVTINGNAEVVGDLITANVTASGDITALQFTGDGGNLTDLNATELTTGTVSNALLTGTYAIDISGTATTAVNVTGNAQPNINSVGTLANLTVTGNTISGNVITAGNISASYAAITNGLSAATLTSVSVNASGTGIFNALVANTAAIATSITTNVLTANTSFETANAQITGNLLANNATVTFTLNANAITAGNVTITNTLSAISFDGAYLNVTGAANSLSVNTTLINASGDVNAGNVLSSGIVTGTNFTASGSVSSLSAAVIANVTAGNINANTNINTTTLAATGNITAANVNSASRVEAAVFVAPAALITTVDATNVVASNAITAGAVQFSGLTADPTPAPGLLYYNSLTGQLRLYNGVLSQWQNLN
jgi:hypothetical protein